MTLFDSEGNRILPYASLHDNPVYFGDTINLPYGNKTRDELKNAILSNCIWERCFFVMTRIMKVNNVKYVVLLMMKYNIKMVYFISATL